MEHIQDLLPLVPSKVSKSIFVDLLEKDETLFNPDVFESLQDTHGFVDREALFETASRSLISFLPKNDILEWMETNGIDSYALKQLLEKKILDKNGVSTCKEVLSVSSVQDISSVIRMLKKFSQADSEGVLEVLSHYFEGSLPTEAKESSPRKLQKVYSISSKNSKVFFHNFNGSQDEENDLFFTSEEDHIHHIAKMDFTSLEVILTADKICYLTSADEEKTEEIVTTEILPFLTEESYLKLYLFYSFDHLINLLSNFKCFYQQYPGEEEMAAHFAQLIDVFAIANKKFLVPHYEGCLETYLQCQVLREYYQEQEDRVISTKQKNYLKAHDYYTKKMFIIQSMTELRENFDHLPKQIQLHAHLQSDYLNHDLVHSTMENVFQLLFYTSHVMHLNHYHSLFQIMKTLNLTDLLQFFVHDQEANFTLPYMKATFSDVFSVKDYLTFGFSVQDFKTTYGMQGIYELLVYLHSEEQEAELVVHLADLKNASISLDEIRQTGFYATAEEILATGVYHKEDLLHTFYPLKTIVSYGFSLEEIKIAGVYQLQDFLQDGSIYLHDLLLPSPALNYSLEEIMEANHYSKDDLKLFLCTNYSLLSHEIKQQFKHHLQFSAKELRDILNVPAKEMQVMGFSLLELIQVKYPVAELLALPEVSRKEMMNYEYFTLENCRLAGVSPELLIEKGYTYDELIEAGIMDKPRPVSVALTVQFFESKASSPLSSRCTSPSNFSVRSIQSSTAFEAFNKKPVPSPTLNRTGKAFVPKKISGSNNASSFPIAYYQEDEATQQLDQEQEQEQEPEPEEEEQLELEEQLEEQQLKQQPEEKLEEQEPVFQEEQPQQEEESQEEQAEEEEVDLEEELSVEQAELMEEILKSSIEVVEEEKEQPTAVEVEASVTEEEAPSPVEEVEVAVVTVTAPQEVEEEGETSCSSNSSTTSLAFPMDHIQEEQQQQEEPFAVRRQSLSVFRSRDQREEEELDSLDSATVSEDNNNNNNNKKEASFFDEFEQVEDDEEGDDDEEEEASSASSNRNFYQPQFSARQLFLNDVIAGKIAMEVIRSHGVTIPELRKHGNCKVKDFLRIGFSLQELKQFPFPINEFKRARIRLKDLKATGYTIKDLKKVKGNVLLMTEIAPPVEKSTAAKEPLYGNNGPSSASTVVTTATSSTAVPVYTYANYLNLATAKLTSMNNSFRKPPSPTSISASWGSSADVKANMYSNQITPVDLRRAGYTVSDLFKAGYPVEDIKKAGYFLEDIKGTGYNYKDLRMAGYSVQELKKVGITAKVQ